MANAELQRASVFAIVRETGTGLKAPTTAAEFIPLKSGFSQTGSAEELESEEIIDDIGPTKPAIGLETPSGEHGVNLKNSETIAQAPEYALLIESALGGTTTKAVDQTTAAASTAGDSAAAGIIKMADTSSYEKGMALLIKDGVNGFSLRNVADIPNGTDLTLNFNLTGAAPASGVSLGRPVLFKPATTGHPSFSAWLHTANGAAVSAIEKCKTSDISITMPAAEKATADFSYAGTQIFWDPVVIDATNDKLNFTDSAATVFDISIPRKIYKSVIALMVQITTSMNATAAVNVFTVSYDSQTGKPDFASDGTPFTILWKTGTNGADNTDTHIGTILGFDDTADDTGAGNYTADNDIENTILAAQITAAFDDADFITVKNAELLVGDFSDNVCRSASEVSFSIATPTEDVKDICEFSGLLDKLILSREVTMSASLVLQKFEAKLFDKFINSGTVVVMMNIGPKDGAGNHIEAKQVNMYLPQATLTQHEISGDDIVVLDITAKGFVSSSKKDFYINFI